MDAPPIGIRPAWSWNEERMYDLIDAISRYRTAGLEIPHEWLEELKHVIQYTHVKELKGYDEFT